MPARYDDISRAAYTMKADATPWQATFDALSFPEQWDPCVLQLCNLGRDPDKTPYYTAPTSRLDATLQALAPQLVVRSRLRGPGADQAADAWLYARADEPPPLPGDVLDRLIGAWAADLRPEPEHQQARIQTLEQLRADKPQWRRETVDLFSAQPTSGGTAAPAARQFQLAPDALARKILELKPYDFGAGVLRFRAVPRGPRAKGAELVSQPLPHEVKKKTWWFSIYINITLHTAPFDPAPRLHVHLGVRRWATHPNATSGMVYLPYKRSTSVYLTTGIPWLKGAPTSDRFAVLQLKRDRATGAYQWGGNSAGRILDKLSRDHDFPDPAQLLANPLEWLGDGDGVRAGIVHATSMGKHGVGAGLMSHQRSKIIEWIEQALPDGMRRLPNLTLTTRGTSAPANPRPAPTAAEAKQTAEERAAQARRTALAATTRFDRGTGTESAAATPHIEVRLLWQTPELRDAAITALTEVLSLDVAGGPPVPASAFDSAIPGLPVLRTWHTPELTVTLRCLRLTAGLGESFGIAPKATGKNQKLKTAIAERRAATAAFLAADGADQAHPQLALVEIDRAQDFGLRLNDPKFALRLGAADAGILTQFALVPKTAKGYNSMKNLSHRVRSAWQDGLRQLGVRVMPEHTLGNGLPANLRYAAVWMVKRRADGPTRLAKHVPVTVMASPVPGEPGLAAFTGWDPDSRTWIPYPDLLLRLVKDAEIPLVEEETTGEDGQTFITYKMWRQNLDEQRQSTERYLQKMIRSLRGQPTVLLAHGQNARMHWTWLQDGKLEPDLIKLGHAPAAFLDPDLRLVRIRSGDGRETPRWWGNAAAGGVNGLPSGLWCPPLADDGERAARVFYSTTPKASTFRDSAVEADKLATRPLRQGKNKGEPTIDTHIPAWNPDLIEIAVAGCHEEDGDVPEAYALAMHQLRQAPDYLDALALPLPMHLASLAQEYVLPTITDSADEADEDTTGDDLDEDLVSEPEAPLVAALGLIPRQRSAAMQPPTHDSDLGMPGLDQEPDGSDYLF